MLCWVIMEQENQRFDQNFVWRVPTYQKARLQLREKPVSFASPRNATDAGIGTVYQDLALNPLTSVTRNFFLGRELTRFKKPIWPVKNG